MELFYYRDRAENFGDDLNAWIWDHLLPGWRQALPGHQLVGVGTILNDRLPRGLSKIVVGSGAGYGKLPSPEMLAECRFVTVRGPRTAAALGLSPDLANVDPAALLPEIPEFQRIARTGRPICIPHTRSVHRLDWASVCAEAGVDYVSPRGEARAVIRRIAAAPLVIAEAMHAAIIADAFRTPWTGLATSEWFHAAKWYDWADSVGAKPEIEYLFDTMNFGKRVIRAYTKKAYDNVSPAGKVAAFVRRLEEPRAVRTLRRLADRPGQLSDLFRLEQARDRFKRQTQALIQEF